LKKGKGKGEIRMKIARWRIEEVHPTSKTQHPTFIMESTSSIKKNLENRAENIGFKILEGESKRR